MFSGFKQPRIVLAVILIALCASLYYTSKLKFDYDFESFFPDNDPALPFFQKHRETFGHDNEFILIALENKKGIFQKDFLEKVNTITNNLKKVRYIEESISPCNLKKVSLQDFGSTQIPLLHYDDPGLYRDDSVYIYTSPEWKSNFFAQDAKSLCVYLKSKQGISKVKSDSLAKAIQACVDPMKFESVRYAGRIFAQAVFLDELHNQFFLFLTVSFLFISLLLWFSFRRMGAVLLPLSLIFLSILFTFGTKHFFKKVEHSIV